MSSHVSPHYLKHWRTVNDYVLPCLSEIDTREKTLLSALTISKWQSTSWRMLIHSWSRKWISDCTHTLSRQLTSLSSRMKRSKEKSRVSHDEWLISGQNSTWAGCLLFKVVRTKWPEWVTRESERGAEGSAWEAEGNKKEQKGSTEEQQESRKGAWGSEKTKWTLVWKQSNGTWVSTKSCESLPLGNLYI